MVSGDCRLAFSNTGVFCVTESGQSTYYYLEPEQKVSSVSQLVYKNDGDIELKDDLNRVVVLHKALDGSNVNNEGPTHFVLGNYGRARTLLYGTELWALDDLANGQ